MGVLEREKGFEPSTLTLARLHSTTELFPRDDPFMQRSTLGVKGFSDCLDQI